MLQAPGGRAVPPTHFRRPARSIYPEPGRTPCRCRSQGTRIGTDDDNASCTLLAIHEASCTWMILSSLDSGAVRLTEEEAVRMAKAILHLVGARAAQAIASTHGE